ncbi:rod shape-determining protein RodA [soil metagenome]
MTTTHRPRPQPTAGPAVRRPLTNFRRNPASPFRHVDIVLVACTALATAFGALMVYSATRGPVAPYDTSYVKRVGMFAVVGGLLMAATALFDYRKLRDYWPIIYGVGVISLVLVLALGDASQGAQRWFDIGPFFQLQPSEPAKLGLIIGFAGLASHFRGDLDNLRVALLLGLCAVPMALVLVQPDLGTALISLAIGFAMLVVAGVRPRILAAVSLVAAMGVAGLLATGILEEYQVDRLTSFSRQDQPAVTEQDEALRFNLDQAKLTTGSGGFTGKGLFNGPQTRNGFVPEQRTDFIFTAVGEQLGFVGAGALLAVLGAICWRVWRTAQLARDDFGMLLCTGVLALLVVQIFENVGMTMGIMPITGLPLPLVSYGGSSMLSTMLALGLVLSVHMRRFT